MSSQPLVPRAIAGVFVVAAASLAGCSAGEGARERPGDQRRDTLIVYLAASLTRPIQPLLDSFAVTTRTHVLRESGGSLEQARKITELGRIPDVILLADEEVFPQQLAPEHVSWWAGFATNRMVVAFTDRSAGAAEISATTWPDVLMRPGVQVGRTDPAVAPAGYRTLLLFQLAESHYRRPGLAESLLVNAPPRNMRGNSADIAALLAAGELDYIYEYESVARGYGLRFLELPAAIHLGDPTMADRYARARIILPSVADGRTPTEIAGRPILYALSIPVAAPHPDVARRFLAYLLDPRSRETLRRGHVELLAQPLVQGSGAPPELNATR